MNPNDIYTLWRAAEQNPTTPLWENSVSDHWEPPKPLAPIHRVCADAETVAVTDLRFDELGLTIHVVGWEIPVYLFRKDQDVTLDDQWQLKNHLQVSVVAAAALEQTTGRCYYVGTGAETVRITELCDVPADDEWPTCHARTADDASTRCHWYSRKAAIADIRGWVEDPCWLIQLARKYGMPELDRNKWETYIKAQEAETA